MIFFQEETVRQFLILSMLVVILGFAGAPGLTAAPVEPRVMNDPVFDALTKAYADLSQRKFPEAQKEFENILKADFDNPYANNNMAVLMEKQGRLADAMTYLNIGAKVAEQYPYKIETLHLIGGVCAAVNPEKATTEPSPIAVLISVNQKKLAERLGAKPAKILPKP